MSTYTPAQLHAAIYRAAERIQNNPSCYDFGACYVPKSDCGTRGCMWGWIGFELGNFAGHGIYKVSNLVVTGERWGDDSRNRDDHLYQFCQSIGGNHHAARGAAIALRAYADKYFPAEKAPTLDPAYEAFRRALLGAPHEQLRLTHQREVVS